MKLLIIPALVLLLLGSAAYYEYSLLQQTTAEVTRIGLTGITLREATLTMDLLVTNPAHVDLTIKTIDATLLVSGQNIANLFDDTALLVPAGGTGTKTLRITVPLKNLGLSALESFRQGALHWQLSGTAAIDVLGFPHTEHIFFENNKA